jgi:hypothetical protein
VIIDRMTWGMPTSANLKVPLGLGARSLYESSISTVVYIDGDR